MSLDADDQKIRDLLRPLGGPSAPAPGVEARLRVELGLPAAGRASTADERDEAVVAMPAPRRRRPAPPRLLVAAAMVLIAVVVTAVVLANIGTDDRVGTDLGGPAPTGQIMEAEARAACDRFDSTAFGALDRQRVLGPTRAEHLTTGDQVRSAAITLRTALATVVDDLRAAGVAGPTLDRPAERSLFDLDHAVQLVDGGQLDAAMGELGHVGNSLLEAQLALTMLGVPNCL